MKTAALLTQMIEKGKNDAYIDGEFEVHKSSDGNQILYARTKIYDSEKNAQRVSDELKSLSKNVYPNLLPVLDFDVKSERRICSTHYVARAYLPYLTVKLSDLIYNNLQSRRSFSNQEAVHLLYQSLSGLAFLHSLGIYHQNLTSACIRQTQTGFALHYDPVNDKAAAFGHSTISPERRKNPASYDKNKDDVYALGIVLLQAGTLQQNLSGSPDQELLRLQSLMPDNQLFYSTVREMIKMDPELRMDSLALITGLPPFDSIKDYFKSNGSHPRFMNSHVPRFWMKRAESERSSYLAPMKQSDGPGRMYSRANIPALQSENNNRVQMIPSGAPSNFNLNPNTNIDQNVAIVPAKFKPEPQTASYHPSNSMITEDRNVQNSPNRMSKQLFSKNQMMDFASSSQVNPQAVQENSINSGMILQETLAPKDLPQTDIEPRTSMIPQNKQAVRKSIDDHHSSLMRKTARASALSYAPNLQKLPQEIVRAENMRTIPEGQTKMIRVDPVTHIDRSNILSLLQEIADGPTDFDTEVEKYSESLKGQDKYFVTPQGQVFRKEETTYKIFDPVEGEKYIVKVQYMPDSVQTKQLNRFRYENKELTPYYMPAWPKYSLSQQASVPNEDYYHLEADTLNIQTQQGTVYVDQYGNEFLSVPVE